MDHVCLWHVWGAIVKLAVVALLFLAVPNSACSYLIQKWAMTWSVGGAEAGLVAETSHLWWTHTQLAVETKTIFLYHAVDILFLRLLGISIWVLTEIDSPLERAWSGRVTEDFWHLLFQPRRLSLRFNTQNLSHTQTVWFDQICMTVQTNQTTLQLPRSTPFPQKIPTHFSFLLKYRNLLKKDIFCF